MNENKTVTEPARDLWTIHSFTGAETKFYGTADDALKQGRKLYGVMNFRIETTIKLKEATI
ncbi:MAG: hypothetical protein J5662_01340 [Clostridia bacterium]|nr:hypothetical protein [Clostridia bacterium]